jgi:hypothetical protein
MRAVLEVQHARDIPCNDQRTLQLRPGPLHGLLELSAFTDPQLGIDQTGFTRLTFRFRDAAGAAWEHSNVLSPYHFWPAQDQVLKLKPATGTWEYGFMASLDDRELVRLQIDTGESLDVQRKYFGFTCRLNGNDGSQSIVASSELGVEHPLADRGVLRVVYEIPVSALLWRPGPVLMHADVLIEDAPYMELRPMQTIDEMPVSALHVVQDH